MSEPLTIRGGLVLPFPRSFSFLRLGFTNLKMSWALRITWTIQTKVFASKTGVYPQFGNLPKLFVLQGKRPLFQSTKCEIFLFHRVKVPIETFFPLPATWFDLQTLFELRLFAQAPLGKFQLCKNLVFLEQILVFMQTNVFSVFFPLWIKWFVFVL